MRKLRESRTAYLRNMYQMINTIKIPAPTIGAYCLSMASKLICCAFFLYLIESFRKLEDKSLILSSESPRYNKSSMFLVITRLTSAKSLLSLSTLECARSS